jgi:hypothetical protein
MTTTTEFYKWWVVDERSGERRLTPYKLTRIDAERAFADAQPDLATGDVRSLTNAGEAPADSRPGANWSRRY